MGVTTSKQNIGFILQLLFNKHHISKTDVELTRNALALFSCPSVEDGLSLRTKQMIFFHHDSNFAHNKKVFDYLIDLFIRKCSPNVYINIYNEENVVRVHPDGRRADGLHPDGRRADGLRFEGKASEGTKAELEVTPSFITNIETWLYNPSFPNTAIFKIKQLIHDVGHAVIIVIKKRKQHFECLYLDSYGMQLNQGQLFCLELEQLTGVRVVDTSVAFCPLQSEFQTGNCKQWALLFILCLLCNPQFITEPRLLVDTLSQNADMNILLFELYLFFVSDYIVVNYKQKLKNEVLQNRLPDRGLELILSKEELTPCFYKGQSLKGNSITFLYENLTRMLSTFQRQKVFLLENAGVYI